MGGNNSTTQTTTQTPYAGAVPLLNRAMGDALTQYGNGGLVRPNTMSTVVPYAQQSMQGLNNIQQNSQAAMGRNPMDGALNYLQDSTAQGGYNAAQRQASGGMGQFANGAGNVNTGFFNQLAGGGQQQGSQSILNASNPMASSPYAPSGGGPISGIPETPGNPKPGGGGISDIPERPGDPIKPRPPTSTGYGSFAQGAGDIGTQRIDQLGQAAVAGNPALMKYNSFSDGAGNIAPIRQNGLADAALNNPATSGFASMSQGQGPSVAESNLMNIAQGGYLNRNDPNFEAALSRATDQTANSVNQQASSMGRTGSGTNQGVLAREVGNLQTDARLNQYNQERQNQTNAINMIDQQKNQGFQNQLGALSGYGALVGAGQDRSLNAANSMAQIQSGNQDRILSGIGGLNNTFQGGLGQGLQAAGMSTDVQGQNQALRMAGLGGQLNAATTGANFQGQNADRQMNAQNSLFGQGQTGQNNLAQAGTNYQSLLAGQNAPAQNLMGVGSAYEDLAGRQLNDQLRIAQESANAPLANIQALLAAAGGNGQYGQTVQTAQGPRNSASNLGGLLLGGGSLLSGLFGA